jgi:hypothetical protein
MGRAALEAEIDAVLATFTDEQRAEPLFFPDAYDSWTEFFRRRYERELTAYDGPPPPARNNAAGRRRSPPVVERAWPHPPECARAHRGREFPRPANAAAGGSYCVAPVR